MNVWLGRTNEKEKKTKARKIKTSSTKGNNRSPESKQVRPSKYFETFSSKRDAFKTLKVSLLCCSWPNHAALIIYKNEENPINIEALLL